LKFWRGKSIVWVRFTSGGGCVHPLNYNDKEVKGIDKEVTAKLVVRKIANPAGHGVINE